MKSPRTKPIPASSLVNIIECRHPSHHHSLLRQFAQMSGMLTTVRNGVESRTWQFDSSFQIQVVEMRHIQEVTPCGLWMEIPTVVIVVYDPGDHDSMQRVTDLLHKEPSVWLPQGCQLALASNGCTTNSPRPVQQLKARAKGCMGMLKLFDILHSEDTMSLLQWTLVVAATRKVPDPDPVALEGSVLEPGKPGVWSKLLERPARTNLLRKMTSKVTLKSATDSNDAGESES